MQFTLKNVKNQQALFHVIGKEARIYCACSLFLDGECKEAVDGISKEWGTLVHTLPGDILVGT